MFDGVSAVNNAGYGLFFGSYGAYSCADNADPVNVTFSMRNATVSENGEDGIFVGNFIAGWLGSFWTGMAKRDFFLMIAAIAAAAAAVIFACNRPLRSALKD